MGFKEILNKGIDTIKASAKGALDVVEAKNAAREEFDNLKSQSGRLEGMRPFNKNNLAPQAGRENMILMDCASVNPIDAKAINEVIPIEETILNVKMIREEASGNDYALVVTNRFVWLVNQKEYMNLNFSDIKDVAVINKGMMSQGIRFNGNAFTITGNENEIKELFEIFSNEEVRVKVIANRTNYLCGVVPKEQLLNALMKGMTIGYNGEVVLHNSPDNKLLNLDEVLYIQLLVNDSVVLIKGKPGVDSGTFVSAPMEARKMSVKVVFEGSEYVIDVMPQNTMGKAYKREDSVYINNYEFSRKIVDKLASIVEEHRKNIYKKTDLEKTEVFRLDF